MMNQGMHNVIPNNPTQKGSQLRFRGIVSQYTTSMMESMMRDGNNILTRNTNARGKQQFNEIDLHRGRSRVNQLLTATYGPDRSREIRQQYQASSLRSPSGSRSLVGTASQQQPQPQQPQQQLYVRSSPHPPGGASFVTPGAPSSTPVRSSSFSGHIPTYQPDQSWFFPDPYAPPTAPTAADRWTDSVIRTMREQQSYAFMWSIGYFNRSRFNQFMYYLCTIIIILANAASIITVLITPDYQDWYGAIGATISLFFVGLLQAFDFAGTRVRYLIASQQLRTLSFNIQAVLTQPADERPNPYELQVGIENRINDILNQANGLDISVASDSFTADPYD